MEPAVAAIVGASLVAATVYLVIFCWRPHSVLKTIVKTTSVAGLAVAGWIAAGPVMLIAALGMGAVGDFFLSRPGQTAFLTGLTAFAAAHLAYVALLLDAGGGIFASWSSIVLVCFAIGMGALLFRHAGALRWPVLGYVAIILAMGLVALGLPPVARLGLIAAIWFILSDAVLGLELFVLPHDHPLRRVTPFAVWTLYWGAQCLFLAGFALGWAT